MKKQILTLTLACLMTAPAAAADGPVFGPGEPLAPNLQAGPGTVTYPTPQIDVSSGKVLSIDDLEGRVISSNLQVQMMKQQLKALKDMDVDEAVSALNEQANQLTTLAQTLQNMMATPEIQQNPVMTGLLTSNCAILNMQAAQLKSQASSTESQLDEQIDTLEEQFRDAENQLVFAAESTFLAIKSMEGSYEDLTRQRAILAATTTEMQKRFELGQISALQLQETKNGMTQLESGIATLAMNIENTKGDLALLLGRNPNDGYTLAALPLITDEQVNSLNFDRDVSEFIRRSTEVRNAREALDDAEDAEDGSRYSENAARLTYENTINSVRQNFQKLCRTVTDKRQLVTAAQSDFALAQKNFDVQKTKYDNGQISQNAYDSAKATLETSRNAVTTAQTNLYTAYMKYDWALRGIVSAS